MSRFRPKMPALFREYPFGVLLATLLILIIGAPMSGQLGHRFPILKGDASIAPYVLLMTLAAAWAIFPTAKNRAPSIILGGFVVVLMYISAVFRHDSFTALHLIAQIAFLVYVIGIVTRVVFRAPVVDGNILCGAAALYLLIGVLLGFIYALIELSIPGAFTIHPAEALPGGEAQKATTGWLIYFSFTTLTTVGFGDVLPASDLARSLAVLEAVIGQILLVVMMARLVGLHVAQVSSGRHRSTPVVFETESEPHPSHKASP